MSEHTEETPEMAKLRKAKAALKSVQTNTASIIRANDEMSNCMAGAAGDLDRIAKEIGEGVGVRVYSDNRYRYTSLKDYLMEIAMRLRNKAV
ncbi:MAG: hypothetical protein KDJ69_16800 [Nitratireductor sp.]|nr:hypothetical protein [Nitratireductor sp.]